MATRMPEEEPTPPADGDPAQPQAETSADLLRRGRQLEILRDCELPRDAKDKTGHGVSARSMMGILEAINHFSGGRPGGCWASEGTLAKSANLGKRTASRAIDVLEQLGLLVVAPANQVNRQGYRGSPTNCYTIVWSELAVLCHSENPLARGAFRGAFRPQPQRKIQSAPEPDQSALGTDQSALGTDQSALGAHKTTRNDKKAPSNDCRDDVVVGARRTFFEDELAAVRSRANRINAHARPRTSADCELVLKIATLWNDGELADDWVETVLESYQRKHHAGDPVRKPMGWLWKTMREQCNRGGLRLEQLLVTCDFPRQLVPAWATREAATTT